MPYTSKENILLKKTFVNIYSIPDKNFSEELFLADYNNVDYRIECKKVDYAPFFILSVSFPPLFWDDMILLGVKKKLEDEWHKNVYFNPPKFPFQFCLRFGKIASESVPKISERICSLAFNLTDWAILASCQKILRDKTSFSLHYRFSDSINFIPHSDDNYTITMSLSFPNSLLFSISSFVVREISRTSGEKQGISVSFSNEFQQIMDKEDDKKSLKKKKGSQLYCSFHMARFPPPFSLTHFHESLKIRNSMILSSLASKVRKQVKSWKNNFIL
ncbi:hypothetical protein ADUPG1_008193 [Aduncisulcus paluster]|uniref:Arp2/3 complex 34 kDa subunit n=1 Tax=Aduncisulcus paluster TaxID=2918883 RepID=A0ABQ5KR29_9EUKA|nr:hypothetical protein ADUPG1_008193 [Aduncisulcus paluster]